MKDKTDIEARARVFLCRHLNVPAEQVVREATFDQLGADSLDTVELMMETEEEFDIQVTDDEATSWLTFGDLVDGIAKILEDPARIVPRL